MDEHSFDRVHGPLLRAVERERGACPDLDELIDCDLEALPERRRAELEQHLELCSTCAAIARPEAAILDEVTLRRMENRLDQRNKPWLEAAPSTLRTEQPAWRTPLLVAAVVLLALGSLALWQALRGPTEPTSVSTVRGSNLQVLAPVGVIGELADLPDFRWQTVLPLDLHYRVEVETADGTPIWRGETDETTLSPSFDLLQALRQETWYRWRVVGLGEDGDVIAESVWTELSVSN